MAVEQCMYYYDPLELQYLCSCNLQVMLPDGLKGRFYHSTTIKHWGSIHKWLIHFGGLDELPEGEVDTWHPVAETTIVELGEWSAPH